MARFVYGLLLVVWATLFSQLQASEHQCQNFITAFGESLERLECSAENSICSTDPTYCCQITMENIIHRQCCTRSEWGRLAGTDSPLVQLIEMTRCEIIVGPTTSAAVIIIVIVVILRLIMRRGRRPPSNSVMPVTSSNQVSAVDQRPLYQPPPSNPTDAGQTVTEVAPAPEASQLDTGGYHGEPPINPQN